MTTRRTFLATGAAAALMTGPLMAQGRPTVVCDNYPLTWMAMRLAGDLADVSFPVPEDVDPSFWQPSIAEISVVQAADLIVLNGAGFAGWTTKATLPRARTVDTSIGFADVYIATDTVTHSHGGDGEHSHTGKASYTWLDFALAAQQAEVLAAALAQILPDAAQTIDKNLANLMRDLADLDTKSREVGVLAASVPMIASHPRYQYFARAYGLNLSAVDWDAKEPPTEVQWFALEKEIASSGANIFVWETALSAEAADRITQMGLVTTKFPTLANTPAQGNFLNAMAKALTDLENAIKEASSR